MLEMENEESLNKLKEAKRLLWKKISENTQNQNLWKHNALLQEFVALLSFAIKHHDYFSEEDQVLLIDLANSTTQKITNPDDTKNNERHTKLMSQIARKAKEEIERGDSEKDHFWIKVALCVTGGVILASGIATAAICFATGNPVAGWLALAGTAILMAAVFVGWDAVINKQKRCQHYGLFNEQIGIAVSKRPAEEVNTFEIKPDSQSKSPSSAFFQYPKSMIPLTKKPASPRNSQNKVSEFKRSAT